LKYAINNELTNEQDNNMKKQNVEQLFNCNLESLSKTLGIEINRLKDELINGQILVFFDLNHMAQFYMEAELPWKECLLQDLKNKEIIYTQFQFWMPI